REAMAWQWQMLAYGVILIVCVFFLPRGIVPAIRDVRSRAASRQSSRPPLQQMLIVEDLRVEFGGVVALAGISFRVQPGTITSLIGPNGAGKTTAFNAITGYLRPSHGRVAWEGQPLDGRRPCDIARHGVVRTFQRTSVFPALSVFDNVRTELHLRGSTGPWSRTPAQAR